MGYAVPCANISGVYHPRRPGDSPLYRLVLEHFTRFEQVFFLCNRRLLSLLSAAAAESLRVFFRTVLGLPEGVIGAVLAIQTFGDSTRWYPLFAPLWRMACFVRAAFFMSCRVQTCASWPNSFVPGYWPG